MLLLSALLCLALTAQALEFQLEASYDGINFAPAGVIEGNLKDQSLPFSLTRTNKITTQQQKLLGALAERNGFFMLRAVKDKGQYVQASVRAACLAASGQSTVSEQARTVLAINQISVTQPRPSVCFQGIRLRLRTSQ